MSTSMTLLLAIGIPVVYVAIAIVTSGVTMALVDVDDVDRVPMGVAFSIVWPITALCFGVYQAAIHVERLVRQRRTRVEIPKAKVRP